MPIDNRRLPVPECSQPQQAFIKRKAVKHELVAYDVMMFYSTCLRAIIGE